MKTPEPSISIIDVGHGNAAVIRDSGVTLVIDTGSRSDLLEFLSENDIKKIDLLLISHSDADHIGGLVGLIAAGIKIDCVRVNSDADKESAAWRDLVITLEDARRENNLDFIVGLSSGDDPIQVSPKCKIEIVAPTPELIAFGAGSKDRHDRRITSNTISACFRILFNEKPIALLAGDMDDVSLDSCIASKEDLNAQVLVFPHHGGLPGGSDPTAFTNKLLTESKPDRVFFSIGRTKFDNPRPEAVEAARRSGAYIACTQLSKHCTDDPAASISNVSSSYSAGAAKGHCCAGTITIDLNNDRHFINHEEHIQFLSKVKNPICCK